MPTPSLLRLRLATLLLPPLGLILLWRHPGLPLRRKLLGTAGIFCFSILHAALVILLLMLLAGLEVEWRGGFPPVLTWHKTKTDYNAIEAHRAHQLPQAAPALSASPAAYWTDYRGPQRDGHYAEGAILTNWPATGLRLLWRQPIGGGYASFVMAGGLAFTIEQRRTQEAIVAYDIESGRELWAHSYPAHFNEAMGGEGPRATPTWQEGRLYSLGGEGEFRVLEAATGRLLWHKDILTEFKTLNNYFGMAASPLVLDDKVIVLAGGLDANRATPTHQTVLAFERMSGRLLWSALSDKTAYASPMLVQLNGQRQLLVTMASRIVGLQPASGALLWEFPWQVQYDNSTAQPVLVGTNRFVVSGGYGSGSVLVELASSAQGMQARQVWKSPHLKTKFNSAVFHDGFLYGLDEGILICLDAATGARRWKEGRYGYGQLLVAGDHLIVLSGEGELVLLQATPEAHRELARFPAIKGKTWNNPALAGGRLLVRNAAEMACFDITP